MGISILTFVFSSFACVTCTIIPISTNTRQEYLNWNKILEGQKKKKNSSFSNVVKRNKDRGGRKENAGRWHVKGILASVIATVTKKI